jgi:spore germination protein KB
MYIHGYAIGRKYPGKTIIEYSKDLMGTFLSKLLGLVLTVYFTLAAANCISMYIHHLTDFLLTETPFLVVTVLHIAIICYLIWKGPEVIARMGIIAFSLAILFYFLVFLASLSEINFNRLLPIFGSSILNVTKASFIADSFVGINQILIAMLLPLVANQKKALRSAAAGVSIGGTFFVFYFIVELMVMGPQVVALMRIASMDFVRSIQITQYLHRFESFMVALWYWSMLVQAGILTYCAQKAFVQTIGVKKEKTNKILVFAFGIIILILTYFLAYDRVFFLNYREFKWQYFALPVHYGLPVLLLLFMLLKKALSAIRHS